MTNENRLNRVKADLRQIHSIMCQAQQANWTCSSCGRRPLRHNPMARIYLCDWEGGMCAECAQKLAELQADYILMVKPRGLPPEPDSDHPGE